MKSLVSVSGNRPVTLKIQWVFLLVQEHRPTLFAARRCAAGHVAEHEEVIDGSDEFFWQVHQVFLSFAVFLRGLIPGKAPEPLQLLPGVLPMYIAWHIEPISAPMHWPSQVLKVVLDDLLQGSEQISPFWSLNAVIFWLKGLPLIILLAVLCLVAKSV